MKVIEDARDDILNMMLQYQEKNPSYTIEEQVDDFLTFFVAGLILRRFCFYFNVNFCRVGPRLSQSSLSRSRNYRLKLGIYAHASAS